MLEIGWMLLISQKIRLLLNLQDIMLSTDAMGILDII